MRGNPVLRRVDRYLGSAAVWVLAVAVRIRAATRRRRGGEATPGSPVVVICYGAIGDLLLLAAVLATLPKTGPVYLACTATNRPATDLYPGLFDAVFVLDLRDPTALARVVRRTGARVVYDSTQWALVSAVHVGVAKQLRPALHARGFTSANQKRAAIYDVLVEHSPHHHETDNFARLLGLNTPIDGAALVADRSEPPGPRVVLHMWAAGINKNLKEWPEHHWVVLADLLARHQVEVFLSGAPADRERNAAFAAKCTSPPVNLAGTATLAELSRFLHDTTSICVSVNTGTMHLAALAGTPVVALTGPTNPLRWGPVGDRSVSLLPAAGASAYLHYGFEYPKDLTHAYAMDALAPLTVWRACATMLGLETDTTREDAP